MRVATSGNAIAITRMIVEAALSSGEGIFFARVLHMTTGSVSTPCPFRNSVTMSSSKENVKDRRAAEMMQYD